MSSSPTTGTRAEDRRASSLGSSPVTNLLSRPAVLDPVYEALSSNRTRVLSLDVFDTLVWRTTRQPTDVFHLLGKALSVAGILAPGVRASDFAGVREAAEHSARAERQRAYGDTEVNIYEIYDRIPNSLFTRDTTLATLVDYELQTEASVLVPTFGIFRLIEVAVSRRVKLALVSDTYLTGDLLKTLLGTVIGTKFQFDVILTSSDYRRHKAGGLFSDLLTAVSSPPESVVHVGDNVVADVKSPRTLGIRAFHLSFPNRWLRHVYDQERSYIEARASFDVEKSAKHATIHRVRSEVLNSRSRDRQDTYTARATGSAIDDFDDAEWPAPGRAAARSYGVAVLGPVLTGFSEWVVRRCAEEAIPVALCPLREGRVLAPLLAQTAAYLGSNIDARELAVNRTMLLRAQLANPDAGRIEEALIVRGAATVGEACQLLGVEGVPPLFGDHRNTRLSDPVVRARFLEALTSDAQLVEAIRSSGVAALDQVSAELARVCHGIASGDRIALVDLGWGGTIQRLLRAVLEGLGLEIELIGLYLATNANGAKLTSRQRGAGQQCFGWVSTLGAHAGADSLLRCPEVVEQVCTAPWPRSEGGDGATDLEGPAPRQAAVGEIPDWQRTEASAAIEGVHEFHERWAAYASMRGPHRLRLDDAHDVCLGLLLRAIEAPTPAEVGTFGRWLHDEGRRAHLEPIAKNPQLARYLSLSDLEQVPMEELYWPWGSAAQADPELPRIVALSRSGALDPNEIHPALETGPITLTATDSDARELSSDKVVPHRNHRGLSYARLAVAAPAIAQVELAPASGPCVIRVDSCVLNLTVQGQPEPLSWQFTDLTSYSSQRAVELINTVHIGAGVLLCHNYQPIWRIDVATLSGAVCSLVQFEIAFALLPIPELLQALEPHTKSRVAAVWDLPAMERRIGELDALISDITSSLSWRITAPLRRAKNVVTGRFRKR